MTPRHPMPHELPPPRPSRIKQWLAAIGLLILAALGSLAWWSPW